MSKFKFDLDEYDDDFDDVFNDSNDIGTFSENKIEEDSDYNKFNQIIEDEIDTDIEEVDYDEDDNDKKDIPTKSFDFNILSNFYKWFLRIGIFIAIVLIALFITNGDILGLFKYLLLLIVSFGLGYMVMFLYDKYKESN